jgi:DnaK suppressor protein
VPHLTDDDLLQCEAQLRLQRDAALEAIRQHLHQSGNADEMALESHYANVREQAEADLLGDTDIALLQIELAGLDEIDKALARLRDGSYGRCACCAARISLKRLRAQPAARLCLPCQETLEKHRLPHLAHG